MYDLSLWDVTMAPLNRKRLSKNISLSGDTGSSMSVAEPGKK
jgi:hypothetical protein